MSPKSLSAIAELLEAFRITKFPTIQGPSRQRYLKNFSNRTYVLKCSIWQLPDSRHLIR